MSFVVRQCKVEMKGKEDSNNNRLLSIVIRLYSIKNGYIFKFQEFVNKIYMKN